MKTARSLFLIAFVFVFYFSQNAAGQNRAVINEAERVTNDRFTVSLTTPRGARVFAVNRPNAVMLNAIDKGLQDLFAIAGKYNYRRRLNYSDYTIFIARTDRTKDSNHQYSPDIAVGAGQYAGTVYDKGGYVYAAGMVVAFNPCAFIIAEHTKNFERVSNVVRYEGEHLILYHNDRQLYNQTYDHSQGSNHPILQ